jgi:hypothetical protein
LPSRPKLRSFRAGNDFSPISCPYGLLHEHLLDMRNSSDPEETLSFRHLETLAVPFFVFYPSDFLPLIASPDNPSLTPSLHHLEIAFFINDDPDISALAEILSLLSSRLRHLSLRIICPDGAPPAIFHLSGTIAQELNKLEKLEYLAVGGHVDVSIFDTVDALKALEHLVILPTSSDFDAFPFADVFDCTESCLKVLTFCTGSAWRFEGDTAEWYSGMVETCEKGGARFVEEERASEYAWLCGF